MKIIYIKLFLRASIALGFLSAVADRFGWWPEEKSTWGNWNTFIEYTKILNPWGSDYFINFIGIFATAIEIILAVFLIIGFKTSLSAKLSGILLVIFGVAMCTTVGIKAPLDYSVFSAAAAGFALSLIDEKYLEIDLFLNRRSK